MGVACATWAAPVLSPRGREHIKGGKRKQEEGYKHRLLLANLVGLRHAVGCCVCLNAVLPHKSRRLMWAWWADDLVGCQSHLRPEDLPATNPPQNSTNTFLIVFSSMPELWLTPPRDGPAAHARREAAARRGKASCDVHLRIRHLSMVRKWKMKRTWLGSCASLSRQCFLTVLTMYMYTLM